MFVELNHEFFKNLGISTHREVAVNFSVYGIKKQ